MTLLADQPAIVTGGGGGVGRGVALALASEGAKVAVLGRRRETLEETCDEIRRRGGDGLAVVCDVRDGDAIQSGVQEVVRAFGGLRILVNNAQSGGVGSLLEIAEEDLEDGWRSGPLATFRFMRICHPYLCGGGVIVNMSSSAAAWAGALSHASVWRDQLACYAAVKAALQSFSRAAAVEWAKDGIRVNTVLPLASTPGYEGWKQANPESYAEAMEMVPLRRLGDPEREVGRAVVFLVGPDAAMITGSTLSPDGGMAYLR